MADKYQTLSGGVSELREATVVSTGASKAGDIVGLDGTGKLDVSVMPAGIGADVAVVEAFTDIPAGTYVNIYDDAGTPKIRFSSLFGQRGAHGFLRDAVTAGNLATVYFEGANDNLSGLTVGVRYYLADIGGVTTTPLDPTDPANVNKIHQFLGIATSPTSINTDIDDYILIK